MTKIDILIYIALTEEFSYAADYFGITLTSYELKANAITIFTGEIYSSVLNQSISIAVVPAGKMGNTVSSNLTSILMQTLKPENIIVLGIAGALHSDLKPGDVFIPQRVVEYLSNAAAEGTTEIKLITSSSHYNSSPRLINRFQLFATTKKDHYELWLEKVLKNSEDSIDAKLYENLKKVGLNVGTGKLIVGEDKSLASGPIVARGTAFVQLLKNQIDRKVVAIDMESAGVYEAVSSRIGMQRVIAIRGISDFADERKAIIEETAQHSFRQLAIKNSIALLVSAIEAGIFASEKKNVQLKYNKRI